MGAGMHQYYYYFPLTTPVGSTPPFAGTMDCPQGQGTGVDTERQERGNEPQEEAAIIKTKTTSVCFLTI